MTLRDAFDLFFILFSLWTLWMWRASLRLARETLQGWNETVDRMAEMEAAHHREMLALVAFYNPEVPLSEPSHPGPYEDLPVQPGPTSEPVVPAPASALPAWRAKLSLGLLRVWSWLESALRWVIG